MKVFILLIFLLSKVSQAQASLAQNFDPDVIRCQDIFYYIGFSSPTLSRYHAGTINKDQPASYQIINGVLKNSKGSNACENQTVQQLWKSKRAFRIQNWGQNSSLSILTAQAPDAIKCQNKILYLFQALSNDIFYLNLVNQLYRSSSLSSLPQQRDDFNCQKSIDQFKADGEAYNVVTQVIKTERQLVNSMTGRYPDAIRCYQGLIFFIYSVNDEQSTVTYRGLNRIGVVQIKFTDNGSVIQSIDQEQDNNCKQKSMKTLISEGDAFNVNSFFLSCPNDITTVNPVVNFLAKGPPEFTLTSQPESGSTFNLGTTQVKVTGTNSNGLKLQCTFKLTRKVDEIAPKIVCPQNIMQNDSIAFYESTATDNSDLPIQISYNKYPGSRFSVGDTTVKATAKDFFGNQSVCTFKVTISETTVTEQMPVVEIILGVLAGVGAISAIVIVLLCKKFKKGCFKVQDQDPIVRPLD